MFSLVKLSFLLSKLLAQELRNDNSQKRLPANNVFFPLLFQVAQSKSNGINLAERMLLKLEFEFARNELAPTLANHVSTADQWTVKGFIDVFKNVYAISSDTKIISRILEIHLFPKILALSERHGFAAVLAKRQNITRTFPLFARTMNRSNLR